MTLLVLNLGSGFEAARRYTPTKEYSLGCYVGAAPKVTPDWSQETMTCHSFNCFSVVQGQG